MITVSSYDARQPANPSVQYGHLYSQKKCEENMIKRYLKIYTLDKLETVQTSNGHLKFFQDGWDYKNTLTCVKIK